MKQFNFSKTLHIINVKQWRSDKALYWWERVFLANLMLSEAYMFLLFPKGKSRYPFPGFFKAGGKSDKHHNLFLLGIEEVSIMPFFNPII